MPRAGEDSTKMDTSSENEEKMRRKIKEQRETIRQHEQKIESLQTTLESLKLELAESRKETRQWQAETRQWQAEVLQAVAPKTGQTTKRSRDGDDSEEEVTTKRQAEPGKVTIKNPDTNMLSPPQVPEKPEIPEKNKTVTETQEDKEAPETPASKVSQTAKIPPVVLREKSTWTTVSRKLADRKIKFVKAKTIGEGISIHPESADDYRKMTSLLKTENHEYHTYALPEDKLLRVVIRGIAEGVDSREVEEDLKRQGFAPTSVQRMTSRRTRKQIPLVLVQVPQSQERILEITRCHNLVVKVEKQRPQQRVSQCYRCQRFGHAQSMCTAQAKCVKCGGNHHSGDCKRTKEVPAKCANCQGAHPASYRGCPSCPKRQQPPQQQDDKPKQAKKPAENPPAPAKTQTGRSFADATKNGAPKPPKSPVEDISNADMQTMLAAWPQMMQMYTAMNTFVKQMTARKQ